MIQETCEEQEIMEVFKRYSELEARRIETNSEKRRIKEEAFEAIVKLVEES